MSQFLMMDGVGGRTCTKCDKWKPFEEYHKNTKGLGGRTSWCKLCAQHYNKQHYTPKQHDVLCIVCGMVFSTKYPKKTCSEKCRKTADSERKKQYYRNNFEKAQMQEALAHHADPLGMMLKRAKKRAKKTHIPFSITRKDLEAVYVKYCPVFKTKLHYLPDPANRNNSASLDKINPSKGYVPGNIEIISYRANHLKNNMTLQEVKALSAHMEARQ